MFVEIERRVVSAGQGSTVALIVHPRARIRLGFDRLQMLEVTSGDASVDLEIVALVAGFEEAEAVLIFRGRSDDGKGSWAFDDRADDAETAELAYRLLAAQLPTFRRLLRLGVLGVAHTDFTVRDARAMNAAAARLARDLEEQGASRRADARIVADLVTSTAEPLGVVLAARLAGWAIRMRAVRGALECAP